MRKKEAIVHSEIKKSPLKHCKWKRQKNGPNLWIFEGELCCHISSEPHKTWCAHIALPRYRDTQWPCDCVLSWWNSAFSLPASRAHGSCFYEDPVCVCMFVCLCVCIFWPMYRSLYGPSLETISVSEWVSLSSGCAVNRARDYSRMCSHECMRFHLIKVCTDNCDHLIFTIWN